MAKFVWLRDSAFPRTGPRLEKGKEHDAEAYGPGVVEEWIKQGAAEMVFEGMPMPEHLDLAWAKKEKKAVKKTAGGQT
jgi:hypothetical protein